MFRPSTRREENLTLDERLRRRIAEDTDDVYSPLSSFESDWLGSQIRSAVENCPRTDLVLSLRRRSRLFSNVDEREEERFPDHFEVVVEVEDRFLERAELVSAETIRTDGAHANRLPFLKEYERLLPLNWTTPGGKRVRTFFEFRPPRRRVEKSS